MLVSYATGVARLDVDRFVEETARLCGEGIGVLARRFRWSVLGMTVAAALTGAGCLGVATDLMGRPVQPFGLPPWVSVGLAVALVGLAVGLWIAEARFRRVLTELALGAMPPDSLWAPPLVRDLNRWREHRDVKIRGPAGPVPPPAEIERALAQLRLARACTRAAREIVGGQALGLGMLVVLAAPFLAFALAIAVPASAAFGGPITAFLGALTLSLVLAAFWYERASRDLVPLEERLRWASASVSALGINDTVELLAYPRLWRPFRL